jgi:hypothetical protein
MLHKLNIKNFTVFSDNQFEFSPGICRSKNKQRAEIIMIPFLLFVIK